jgi:hypothetical protein
MLFQTPAKAAGLMGTLSPVDSVGSVGSKENEDVKMPAIRSIRSNVPSSSPSDVPLNIPSLSHYDLMVGSGFGSQAAEIFASISTELSNLLLVKKPVKVAQVSDGPIVLFEDGTVVAVVYGRTPGHLWGTLVKPEARNASYFL